MHTNNKQINKLNDKAQKFGSSQRHTSIIDFIITCSIAFYIAISCILPGAPVEGFLLGSPRLQDSSYSSSTASLGGSQVSRVLVVQNCTQTKCFGEEERTVRQMWKSWDTYAAASSLIALAARLSSPHAAATCYGTVSCIESYSWTILWTQGSKSSCNANPPVVLLWLLRAIARACPSEASTGTSFSLL